MGLFLNFVIFLCGIFFVQCADYNFWLGEPTNIEVSKLSDNQVPVKIYQCMGNLLCNSGGDKSNVVKACDNIGNGASGDDTDQNNKGSFWKIPDYSKVAGNVRNWLPKWEKALSTIAPNVKDDPEFEDARKELCSMEPADQYAYIREKYVEAVLKTSNSTENSSNPTYNCTVSLMFDLSFKDNCGVALA